LFLAKHWEWNVGNRRNEVMSRRVRFMIELAAVHNITIEPSLVAF
jgi:hypothetical protein